MGDFNHDDIYGQKDTEYHKKPRMLVEHTDDNFVTGRKAWKLEEEKHHSFLQEEDPGKKKKDGQSLLDPWEDDGEAHFGNIFHARVVQENQ